MDLKLALLLKNGQNPFYTKVSKQPIRLMSGETFDGFKENGGKWTRYERGKIGIDDCIKFEGHLGDTVFILYNKAT